MADFDRAAEDVGNIVSLEHVNVQIPDQQLATAFYVMGLGLTRDPFQVVGLVNMWVNAGRCQLHLPTGTPQVVNGHTAVVMPGRANLLKRLDMARKPLAGTRFAFTEKNDHVEAICPWCNRIRVYEPGSRFGRMMPGSRSTSSRATPPALRASTIRYSPPPPPLPTSRKAARRTFASAPTSG